MPQIVTTKQTKGSERVLGAIANASARTGVGFEYLYNQARIESSLDPQARAKTSSAQGLYQFTNQTWLKTVKEHGAEHGLAWAANAITQDAAGKFHVADRELRASILDLRNDPDAASNMAAEHASDNKTFLGAKLGKAAAPVDLYLSHFLGVGGAVRFLTAHASEPDQAAAPIFPAAAAANRSIFYAADGSMLSLDQIRTKFAAKFEGAVAARMAPTQRFEMATAATSPAPPWSRSSDQGATRLLELKEIEPMPAKLSLDFARRAYQRLADMGGGARS